MLTSARPVAARTPGRDVGRQRFIEHWRRRGAHQSLGRAPVAATHRLQITSGISRPCPSRRQPSSRGPCGCARKRGLRHDNPRCGGTGGGAGAEYSERARRLPWGRGSPNETRRPGTAVNPDARARRTPTVSAGRARRPPGTLVDGRSAESAALSRDRLTPRALQTVHLVNVQNLWRFDLDADLIEERHELRAEAFERVS
jgi:hypothetical protein